ncbi:MAG: CHAT domain-containing protein [Actinobacteria bacterium]|nr:CHAT domain-containing protein [Actinomycetota bacterium]
MRGVGQRSGLQRAAELHGRAVAENSAGRPLIASRTLRRAMALLEVDATGFPDRAAGPLLLRILITMAKAEAELAGYEGGLVILGRAAELGADLADTAHLTPLHNQRGVLLLRAGRLDDAVVEFDEAEKSFSTSEALERCNVLLNRGAVRLHQGKLREAREDLSRCAAAARAAQLPLLLSMATHNLGYLEFLAGELALGLHLMQEAVEIGAGINLGVSGLDRARVLIEAGLAAEADEALAEAAATFARDRAAYDLAETELARAECALLAGDVAAARRFAARSRDRFRRRGNARWRRAAELVLLQGDLADGRPAARLAPVALRLMDELTTEGLSLRARTAALVAVECLLLQGQTDRAARLLTSTAGPNEPISIRLHADYLHARLDAAEGDVAAARRHAVSGLTELAKYQASFGAIDLRTAGAVHGRRLAELDVGLAIRHGTAAAVLAAVERSRAVSSRLRPVTAPEDEQSAALLAELRQIVETVRADASQLATLMPRRTELEHRIRARSWRLPGGGHADRPASVSAIRQAVTDDAAVLAVYIRVDEGLYAVVVEPGRIRRVALGTGGEVDALARRVRADLDLLAYDRLPRAIRGAASASLERALHRLDDVLLQPLSIGGRRLVILPTGLLTTLPWMSMRSLRGVPVVVAPSATAWLAARARPVTGSGVVALAGPDLTRAEDEVRQIAASRADARAVLLATRAALTAALASSAVVHVAAHGQHQTENPLFSSIRLADGPLFAHELTAAAPHVVLSACELGMATIRPGDEALGLTSVLLHLGTRTVVSDVARVGDAAAAEAMILYHQRLSTGRDPAEALAEAVAIVDEPTPFVAFGA